MLSNDDDINVLIDFSHTVTLIRYLGSTIVPARLKMRAEVFASENSNEINFDLIFTKIKFWFETVVSRSIVFSRTNDLAMAMLMDEIGKPRSVNHLMVTPYEPNNEHLAVLFQSKMGALSDEAIEFGAVRLETEDNGLVFTYVGDWRDDLPAMKDWFDIQPYYFDQPWWRRNDVSTIDVMPTDADINEPPVWAYKLDFIDNAFKPKLGEEKPDVVIRGAFRPKVITGGKDDK